MALAGLKEIISDIIFPKHCLGCQQEGSYLCNQCVQKIPLNYKFSCPFCGQPSFFGKPCFKCARRSNLESVMVASSYDCEIIKKSVKAFKYQFVEELAMPLGNILIFYLNLLNKKLPVRLNFDYLMAVPLHYKRFLYRGFNQAELLAEVTSLQFGWPILKKTLIKKKFTRPQAELTQLERKDNIKGVFSLKEESRQLIINKKILLIDDILTTGATLNECARVLKEAGAREVSALVLAKG